MANNPWPLVEYGGPVYDACVTLIAAARQCDKASITAADVVKLCDALDKLKREQASTDAELLVAAQVEAAKLLLPEGWKIVPPPPFNDWGRIG